VTHAKLTRMGNRADYFIKWDKFIVVEVSRTTESM